MRIILVDNQLEGGERIAEMLRVEHQVLIVQTGEKCLQLFAEFSPDILLVDDLLPDMTVETFYERVKKSPLGDFIWIVAMCSDMKVETRLHYYNIGADDYIFKPLHFGELKEKFRVMARGRCQIEKLWLAHFYANQQQDRMKDLVREKSEEIDSARNMAVFVIAKLAESRVSGMGQHLERIRDYSHVLAEDLYRQGIFPEIDPTFLDDIYNASPLHDIGKISIPDHILGKKGPLTKEEFEIMKEHCAIGAQTLQSAMQNTGYSSFLAMSIDIARHHHERFDGAGYPDGLSGLDIPLSAQIVSVVDVFDALTSHRVYKKAIPPNLVKGMIEQDAGIRFNPAIVKAFLYHFDDLMEIYLANRDTPAEPKSITYEANIEWW
ncbi:MAG: HD domain-containing protein [Planctomycetaceae bacterium]|jgi:putative two-component system response regulator|nr:HD domain-containing protein [Planctomycetaceae bacterium]